MDDDEQKNYNSMDEDEASDGLPHPQESALPVDGVAQIDVHWTIRGEYFRRNFIVFR